MTVGPITPRKQLDPRQSAPIGAYLTDEKLLVEVIDSEWDRVLAESLAGPAVVEISRVELMQKWRRVRPLAGV